MSEGMRRRNPLIKILLIVSGLCLFCFIGFIVVGYSAVSRLSIQATGTVRIENQLTSVAFSDGLLTLDAFLASTNSLPKTATDPIPSSTAIRTNTSSSTETHNPPITPPPPTQTPEPTLTENQRKDLLFELLHDNTDCLLPCWWEFHPGKTTWEKVRTFILYMGARTGDSLFDDGSIYHGTGGFDWSFPSIYNRIGFYDQDGVLEAVTVRAEGYNDPDFFRTLWKNFSPEQVMKTYGSPSRIYLSTFRYGEINVTSSVIILVYDDYGFFTWYETQALVVQGSEGNMLKVCPSWSDLTWQPKLNMYIKDVDSSLTFERLMKTLDNMEGFPGKPIEQSAGITPEEFYQRFQPGMGPACLETPEEMWQ